MVLHGRDAHQVVNGGFGRAAHQRRFVTDIARVDTGPSSLLQPAIQHGQFITTEASLTADVNQALSNPKVLQRSFAVGQFRAQRRQALF